MSDRVSELETKIAALAEQVAGLADRLASVEAHGVAPRQGASSPAAASPDGTDLVTPLLSALPTLAGRTLLVLAGGFVFRALTEGGAVPGRLGMALGLAYAAVLAVLAERAARIGARSSASAHAVSALLVACPLLYEGVTRFQLLGLAAATAILTLVAAALLLLARRHRLAAVAWTTMALTAATAVALMFQVDRVVPGALFLILLATGCAWLGTPRGLDGLRWVPAALADLGALAVALRALSPYAEEGAGAAALVLAALLALTLLTFALRALLLHREVGAFEACQTAGAVGAGLGGAAVLSAHGAPGGAIFGAAAAGCGLAAYAAALATRTRPVQDRARFPYLVSAGALLLSCGTALALGRTAFVATSAALAIASAWLARRLDRRSLAVHAALYAWASAAAAALPKISADALLAPPGRTWAPLGVAPVIALLAAGTCAWLARPGAAPDPLEGGWTARATWLAHLVLVAGAGTGVAAALLAGLLAGAPGPDASRGTLATTRTAVLVVAAAFLAWAGRSRARREARWVAYGVLWLTGLKILGEDLPAGRPVALVVTFGIYGAALLALPRLRRRERAPAAPPRAA